MIKIDLVRKKLCVSFDRTHPHYQQAYFILRSLLSAKSSGSNSNQWSLSFDDFITFKEKLDSRGLVYDRTMTVDAHNYLKDIQALDKRNQDIKNGVFNDHVYQLLDDNLKTTPYKDQITGISYLVNNYRAGLFDSMGVGKSLQALGAVTALKGKVRRTLIVCPKSVLVGFSREIQKHTYLKSLTIPSGRKTALDF